MSISLLLTLVLLGVLLLLLQTAVTGFLYLYTSHHGHLHHHTRYLNALFHPRRHISYHNLAALPSSDDDILWEDQLREEATSILLNVFFPKDDDGNCSMQQKPITAELSLKRILRKKYQRVQNVNKYRGRLAALCVGTSIHRLRHWYVVAAAASQNKTLYHDVPYPLDPSLLTLVQANNNIGDDSFTNSLDLSISDQERHIVRAMVDEHAVYLSSNASSSIPSMLLSNSNIDASTKLSIQYSMPLFLTSSFLKQYTYTQTEGICKVMNNPGPITLRRNAIQFPGSDEELCKYLLKEDGITAKPCRPPTYYGCVDHDQNNKLVVAAFTDDGSNRYIVRKDNSILPGSILPPTGAIQIIQTHSNATARTSVEQRRSQKSIWSMKAWQNGYFEVQDVGSQIIVQSLEVRPGDTILDYCAGNGGKTFTIASVLASYAVEYAAQPSSSHIVAHDVVEERLRQIKGSMPRVGFVAQGNATGDTFNSTIYTNQNNHSDSTCTIQIATSSDLEKSFNSKLFDTVLVDAPCSSTGVFRRRPSQRWELDEKEVCEVLPSLQLEILMKASSYVNKNGGKLVYSTCSLLKEENEDVIKQFEQSSIYRTGGFERWEFDTYFDEESIGVASNHSNTITLLPSKESDGFFIARWKVGKMT